MTEPLALARLLEGRSNAEREAAVAQALESRDLGSGDRVFVLCAHHDAVPGSPGANDNAAAVGILLTLLERVAIPPGLRVRLLFTAAEERDCLGAREYVRAVGVSGIVGVLSLELCGIGDNLVVWDATAESPVTRATRGALESAGLKRDESYHVVGRIPRFGSDHRAFAGHGNEREARRDGDALHQRHAAHEERRPVHHRQVARADHAVDDHADALRIEQPHRAPQRQKEEPGGEQPPFRPRQEHEPAQGRRARHE